MSSDKLKWHGIGFAFIAILVSLAVHSHRTLLAGSAVGASGTDVSEPAEASQEQLTVSKNLGADLNGSALPFEQNASARKMSLKTELEAVHDEFKLQMKEIDSIAEAKETRAAGMPRPHTTKTRLHNESLVQMVPFKSMGGAAKNTPTTHVGRLTSSAINQFLAEVWNDKFKRNRAYTALAVCVVSAVIGQQVLWMLFSRVTLSQRSSFFTEISKSIRGLMICLAFLLGTAPAHFVLDYSPDVSAGARACEAIVHKICVVGAVICLSGITHAVHVHVERYLNKPLSITETERRGFIHMICQPTGIEEPVDDSMSLQLAVFRWIWMPFYVITQGTTWLVLLLYLFGFDAQVCVIAIVYFGLGGVGVVFGAHTIGKDIYGGMCLLMEKPFHVGDLISVEDKGGGGQCPDAIVTGFVEQIRLRSTTIRRFDMRSCIVPNHFLAEKLVSNWKRPRKLIFFQFSIAHRTPISAVKLFSEKALFIVKNHPDVDQNLYIKACFRKIDAGYNFQVVCYNGPDTRKQFVQQDLIYRFSTLAHDLGIVITFDEKSVSVQREQIDTYYQKESAVNLSADLSKIVPDKKEKISKPTHAPKGTLLARVDHLFVTGLLSKSAISDWIDKCFYVKLSHPDPVALSKSVQEGAGVKMDIEDYAEHSTSFQHVDHKANTVSWFESLGFQQDPKLPVPKMMLVQVFMQVGMLEQPELIAAESVDMALLSTSNSEPLMLSPKTADCKAELKISLKFFLGKDLTFEGQSDEDRAEMNTHSKPLKELHDALK